MQTYRYVVKNEFSMHTSNIDIFHANLYKIIINSSVRTVNKLLVFFVKLFKNLALIVKNNAGIYMTRYLRCIISENLLQRIIISDLLIDSLASE